MKTATRYKLRRAAACLVASVAAVACAFALALALPTQQAHAALAERLVVSVGYYGGPYYTKASYTESEMRSMSDGLVYQYSTFDSAVYMRKGFGRGVYLTTLLQNAGVGLPFYAFYFVTSDTGYADTYTWLYSDLIGTTRYYYPDYPYYYDFNVGGFAAGYAEGLRRTAVVVPAILAIDSSFTRISGSTWQQEWNDSSGMSTQSGYRVMYGEYGPGQYDSRGFAQNVLEVRCLYDGAPTITFDKSDISGEVGSSVTLTPTIHANDTTIASQGIYDIKWSTSDSSVATITTNDDGSVNVNIWSEGNVTITAEFGNSANHKATATVGGTGVAPAEDEPEDEDDPEASEDPNETDEPDDSDDPDDPEDPDGSGSGEGSGSGDGTGSGTGSGSGTGDGTGSGTGSTGSSSGGWSDVEVSGSGTEEGTSSLPEGAQLVFSAEGEISTESRGSTEGQASPALQDEVGLGGSAGGEGGGSVEALIQRLRLSSDAVRVNVIPAWRYAALMGGLLAVGFTRRAIAYKRSKDRFMKRKIKVWKHSATA